MFLEMFSSSLNHFTDKDTIKEDWGWSSTGSLLLAMLCEALGLIARITYGRVHLQPQHSGGGKKSEVQGHPWLHGEFRSSLGYKKPCLKNKNKY